MTSLWDIPPLADSQPLAGDTTVEAAVIGGGMAGILTAYKLRQRHIQAVVLDARAPGQGVTRFTTAKVTSQHGLRYARLLRALGEDGARLYADAMQQAIEDYAALIEKEHIDCDWQQRAAYVYDRKSIAPLEEEQRAAAALGLPASLCQAEELPFSTTGALRFDKQAAFHPLKFLVAIARDIPIYSSTFAQSIDGHMIFTDRGCITARHIIVATHFPFVNIPGWYFLRMHQERHDVWALSGAPALQGMYIDANPQGYSFRQAGAYLLVGGNGRRTGKAPEQPGQALQDLKNWYPLSTVSESWWTQDCVTQDGLPLIGRYAAAQPNWYVATGFNKWGMTGSMAAATLLTDLITGKDNPAASLFSPKRRLPRLAARAFLQDAGQSTVGLTRGLFSKKERRCPHLGCQMQYEDGVWHCPCHGSAYDEQGQWLYGPATSRRHTFPDELPDNPAPKRD